MSTISSEKLQAVVKKDASWVMGALKKFGEDRCAAMAASIAFYSAFSLAPTLVMVGIMTISGYFQLFAEPYVMTQGGPLRSTVSVLYFMYDEGFRWWNLGNASAVAFLLFIVIFSVSWVLLRFDRDPEASA